MQSLNTLTEEDRNMANFPDLFRGDRGLLSAADPFADVDDLFSRFNQMWAPVFAARSLGGGLWQPRVEVEEMEDSILLRFEVPGLKQDEIKIDVQDNMITVSAERKQEEGVEGRRARRGTRFERFQRGFTLPVGIDENKIEASYDSGILEVLVPKSEAAKPRAIAIKAGAGLLSERLQSARSQIVGEQGASGADTAVESGRASASKEKATQPGQAAARH